MSADATRKRVLSKKSRRLNPLSTGTFLAPPLVRPSPQEFRVLRSVVLVTAFLALTQNVLAAPSVDPARIKQIDADVRAILDRTLTPSAVIAVVEGDRIVYRKAYGLRDRDRRLHANVDTFYEIGSITKQFTAAAILQFQERGKLDIDDKLA